MIEYCANYLNTLRSLWQFKRVDVPANNVCLTIDNSKWFKDKATPLKKAENVDDGKNFDRISF